MDRHVDHQGRIQKTVQKSFILQRNKIL